MAVPLIRLHVAASPNISLWPRGFLEPFAQALK